MDVRCEKCSTEYEFDEERVGANGVTVKCTACGYVFKVRRPRRPAPPPRASTNLGKGPQGREWLVKKPDGQMIAFRELTTLQKWIVEGRIARDDEISKNGETWKRLGNILELEPFFSVYEKARALNELIERGSATGAPVQLRGSEVLATMSPLSSLPLEGATQAPAPAASRGPIPRAEAIRPEHAIADGRAATERGSLQPRGRAETEGASGEGRPLPRSTSGSFVRHVPPPLPGAGLASHPEPLPAPPMPPPSRSITGDLGAPSRSITGDLGPSRSITGDLGAPPRRTFERSQSGIHSIAPAALAHDPMSTNLPGPGALGSGSTSFIAATARPRRASSGAFDVDEDLGLGPDPVARLERQQRARRVLGYAGILIALGAAGGIALATLGPTGNPLQLLAERWGLLQPRVQDDGAGRHLEEAQRAIDLDTLPSLERAESLLELAAKARPNDPAIDGDRALVMIVRGEALRRSAADRATAADEAERARATWAQEVEAAKLKGTPPPEAPATDDPAALRAEVTREGEAASLLIKRAFEVAVAAYRAAPEAFEPARALSEYYRVQQDTAAYTRELARAKLVIERSGATDPALLYGEAAARLTAARPSAEDLASAKGLLEQALSTRPSMNRARVLLGRVHLLAERWEPARMQLDPVLQVAPDHREARWLRELAVRAEKERMPQAAAAAIIDPTPAKPAPAAPQQPAEAAPAEDAKPTFQGLMAQGDRLLQRDKPKAALAAYERAASLAPKSAEPLTGMGWSYIDLEKPEAALNMFRRAQRVNDRYAEAYYGEAEANRLLGKKDEAIEGYERYLARAPNGEDRRTAERRLAELRP